MDDVWIWKEVQFIHERNLTKTGENKYKCIVKTMSEIDSADIEDKKLDDNILDLNIDEDECSYGPTSLSKFFSWLL